MIVDAIIHAYNFAPDNLVHERYSPRFAAGTFSHHVMWSPKDSDYVLTEEEFVRDFDEEVSVAAALGESPVDVTCYHATPIYDFFKDGLVSIEKGARLKEKYPDRVLLYGAIPLLNKRQALSELERQVRDYGVDGLKFYPAVFVDGKTVGVSLSDPETAIPVMERALELGISNVAIHKALPLGPTDTAPYRVDDLSGAAAALPEMNFQIVHAGLAFTEETALLMARFPNIYAALEGTFGYICQAPKAFFRSIGMLAEWSGYDRLLFASGCNVAHPRPLIERFLASQMPDEFVDGYGYPPLTDEDKELVLGANFARLHGLDAGTVPTDDVFARMREIDPQPWSLLRNGQEGA